MFKKLKNVPSSLGTDKKEMQSDSQKDFMESRFSQTEDIIKEEATEEITLSISDTQYGPLLPYVKDDNLTDVDFNGEDLWIKDIHNIRTKVTDETVVSKLTKEFIDSFVTTVGNVVGEDLTPMNNRIEAETEELRITVLHESIARTGTSVCIRKTPPVQRITPKKAIEENYATEEILHLLANCVKAQLNMVVCGETGVGKTECLKFLTSFIPAEEKVITVEDTMEVHYRKINPGKDCMELRVNEFFSYDDAMEEVLRLTPNRVMLSEARASEVMQLVKCWTTGITGFCTLHTDDVRKIADRILNMMPSREDADRMENDIYTGLHVGVLLDVRYNEKIGRKERYISQIAFFERENNRNRCHLIVRNGELLKDSLTLTEEIESKIKRAGIKDILYSEELMILMKKEEERKRVLSA